MSKLSRGHLGKVLGVALGLAFAPLIGGAAEIPANPVLTKSAGLPGFYIWKVSVPVEPFYAYEVSWSTHLSDGFNSGSSLDWEYLGDQVTSFNMLPTRLPVFVKVDYHRAFAPRLMPDEIYSLLLVEVEGDLAVTPRAEENRYDASYKEVEDGVEVTFFCGIAYDRTDLNAAEIRFTIGTVRARELSSGEVLDFDIQQLATLSGEVLPMAITGAIEFTDEETGTVDFKTIYTDQSEGGVEIVSF